MQRHNSRARLENTKYISSCIGSNRYSRIYMHVSWPHDVFGSPVRTVRYIGSRWITAPRIYRAFPVDTDLSHVSGTWWTVYESRHVFLHDQKYASYAFPIRYLLTTSCKHMDRPGSTLQAKLGSCLGREVDKERKILQNSLLAFSKVKF